MVLPVPSLHGPQYFLLQPPVACYPHPRGSGPRGGDWSCYWCRSTQTPPCHIPRWLQRHELGRRLLGNIIPMDRGPKTATKMRPLESPSWSLQWPCQVTVVSMATMAIMAAMVAMEEVMMKVSCEVAAKAMSNMSSCHQHCLNLIVSHRLVVDPVISWNSTPKEVHRTSGMAMKGLVDTLWV